MIASDLRLSVVSGPLSVVADTLRMPCALCFRSSVPEGRIRGCRIPDEAQIRGLEPLLTLVQRFDGRCEDSGRHQGPFDGVWRSARHEHLFDVPGQRVEEIRLGLSRGEAG